MPSATIDLGDRIKRLRAEGRDVLNLISGAPEFDTPPEIKREAHAALDEDYRFMTYSLSAGLEDLRRVIADKLRGENGIAAEPERHHRHRRHQGRHRARDAGPASIRATRCCSSPRAGSLSTP